MRIVLSHQSIPVEKKQWILIVVLEKQEIIGSCTIDRPNQNCPSICNLFVCANHRRRGVATKLIEECFKYARSKKKHSISLSVSKKNKEAILLYKKLGFNIYYDDDTIWMAKTFARL
jgi:ribosomal protein S18 acetylase RimI-like enzyme